MNTKKFRTRTEIIPRKFRKLPDSWIIGLDLGYSGVKLVAPNKVACFPSYAKRVDNDFGFVGKAPKNAIMYRDEASNQMWLVGEIAQNTMSISDTSESENALYGRERYDSAMFKVLIETSLGIGIMGNEHGQYDSEHEELVIQTGLPQKYIGNDEVVGTDKVHRPSSDEIELTEAIATEHKFSIKIGAGNWQTYTLTPKKENVYIISQPKGTLFSVCVNEDGSFVPEAEKLLTSSGVVFDAGFGTLDLFPIKNGTVERGETFPNLGMKRVLQETSSAILTELGVSVSVPAMQKNLETGTVISFDKKKLISEEKPFESILNRENNKVCDEAITAVANCLRLNEYSYMIITGGTGAAWYQRIADKLKGLSTLALISGERNDTLTMIYSNVRGFYFYRLIKLKTKR